MEPDLQLTVCFGGRVSLVENARLFAELYLTIADTFIAVWDEKGYYSFWRPITAIREADTDGNSRYRERRDQAAARG